MELLKLFTFRGRLNRLKFFLYQLTGWIILRILSILANVGDPVLFIFSNIAEIIVLAFLFLAIIRRLHDINLPGIIFLVHVIAYLLSNYTNNHLFDIISLIFIAVTLIVKGTNDSNKYGDNPLGPNKQTETLLNEVE